MIVECPGCKNRYDVSGKSPGTLLRCRCGHHFTLHDAGDRTSSIRCKQCGASVSSQAKACSYCETPLLIVTCPRCFGSILAGSKHCSHCGARVDEPALPFLEVSGLRCPSCEKRPHLVPRAVGETMVDTCGSCLGMFVEGTTLERLVRERDAQARMSTELTTVREPGGEGSKRKRGAEAPNKVAYRPCPRCDALMLRKNFGRRSGVIIDSCKAHGVWFDEDELMRCLNFILSGKFDEARRVEMEELDRQIRARRVALDAPPNRGTVVHDFAPSVSGELIGCLLEIVGSAIFD